MSPDEKSRLHQTQLVDEASAESFPASDPPAFTQGHVHDPAVTVTAAEADEERTAPAPTHDGRLVDEASAESFPASDPPAFAQGHAHDPGVE